MNQNGRYHLTLRFWVNQATDNGKSGAIINPAKEPEIKSASIVRPKTHT